MCFKTASLPAPSKNEAEQRVVTSTSARYFVRATGTREVTISVGSKDGTKGKDIHDRGTTSQYFSPKGLREFATQLNELADKLEA